MSEDRTLLPSSRRRMVLLGVLAVVVVLGGAYALGAVGVPSVTGVDNRFGGVNESTTVIETDLHVSNPNPLGVSLGGVAVQYDVALNDVNIASGRREGVSIEKGKSTLGFTTRMDNEKIPAWWVSHLNNGEQTTLAVDARVKSSTLGVGTGAPDVTRQIDTDLTAAFNSSERQPVNASAPLVEDPVLYINETSGHWGTVTENRTEIEMTFEVYNPKPYPVAVSEIGYDIGMNDVAMGEGATQREVVIPPQSSRTIEATTVMRNERLDEWWVSHLERNQVTELRVDFYLRVDLSAAGAGTAQVPLDEMNQTMETDIFGTKNESAAGGTTDGTGESTGETSTPASTPTDTSESTPTDTPTATETPTPTLVPVGTETPTPTDTPTETETPTATPTETPTPDGLLALHSRDNSGSAD